MYTKRRFQHFRSHLQRRNGSYGTAERQRNGGNQASWKALNSPFYSILFYQPHNATIVPVSYKRGCRSDWRLSWPHRIDLLCTTPGRSRVYSRQRQDVVQSVVRSSQQRWHSRPTDSSSTPVASRPPETITQKPSEIPYSVHICKNVFTFIFHFSVLETRFGVFLPCDSKHSAVMRLHVVCPSVCPSVSLRYAFHTAWNTSKIISRPNSLRNMLHGTEVCIRGLICTVKSLKKNLTNLKPFPKKVVFFPAVLWYL